MPKSAGYSLPLTIVLCSTINVFEKYGVRSQEKLFEMTGISVSTIKRYNKKLQELKVICFSEHRNGVSKTGTFLNIPKLYAMPDNAECIGIKQEECIEKAIIQENKAIKQAERERKKQEKELRQQEKQNKEYESKNPCDWGSENPFAM